MGLLFKRIYAFHFYCVDVEAAIVSGHSPIEYCLPICDLIAAKMSFWMPYKIAVLYNTKCLFISKADKLRSIRTTVTIMLLVKNEFIRERIHLERIITEHLIKIFS